MSTPVKSQRCQPSDASNISENTDPNVPISTTPCSKPSATAAAAKTPITKSAKLKKSAPKTPQPNTISPPPPPPPAGAAAKERKFFVAKKNLRRPKEVLDVKNRRLAAYEALRQSQEEFFKKPGPAGDHPSLLEASAAPAGEDPSPKEVSGGPAEATEPHVGSLSAEARRMRRSLVMEEALSSVPEPGLGRVKHLVKAFESLLSISKETERTEDEGRRRVMNWALPGLQQQVKVLETEANYSTSVSSSVEFLASKDFERNLRLYSSMDSNGDRLSCGSRTSSSGRRSRRNSTDSSGRSWTKKLKVTSQHPFKLRTEQRGRIKEEHFIQKVKEMLMEEEKKRIPIAQGLPWTTDEPECLVKPPVKEPTEPLDLLLHSDVRAVERAEFDHYVAERMSFAEQMRLERERQRKLEEEEEIRRLRRELVPKAQPMPYFDRPFVPKKSTRPRTVPKEPRFHIRPLKPCVSMMER